MEIDCSIGRIIKNEVIRRIIELEQLNTLYRLCHLSVRLCISNLDSSGIGGVKELVIIIFIIGGLITWMTFS